MNIITHLLIKSPYNILFIVKLSTIIIISNNSCNIIKATKMDKQSSVAKINNFDGIEYLDIKKEYPYFIANAMIDDIPLQLIIDYGAGGALLLSNDVRNGLSEKVRKAKFKGINPDGTKSKMEIGYFISENFKLGEIPFEKIGVLQIDFTDINRELNNLYNGLKVDGLIGINALSQMVLEMNLIKEKIALYTFSNIPKYNNEYYRISYQHQSKYQETPVIKMKIDGVEIDAVFDTGYNGFITIYSDSLYNRIEGEIITTEGTTIGGTYKITYKKGLIGNFNLGSLSLNKEISVSLHEGSGENECVIGMSFLRAFFSEIIVNPSTKEILLKTLN